MGTIVWMQHDEHGVMPCYSTHHVARNEANGWRRCAPPGASKPNPLLNAAVVDPPKRAKPRKVTDGDG